MDDLKRIDSMIAAECSFKRKYMYSMGERYSKFRRRGVISLDDKSVRIQGGRLYNPAVLRGLIILTLTISTGMLIGYAFLFFPLLMLYYYLFQFVILKRENLLIGWEQIEKFEIDFQNMLIAFSIKNNSCCSPVVFRSQQFEVIASAFRSRIGDLERTSHGLSAVEQRYDEQVTSMSKYFDKLFDGK